MLVSSSDCEFEVDRGPDWLFVKIKGLDSGASAPALANNLWSLAEQNFTYRLLLELDEVEVLDSHLIDQLLTLRDLVGEREGVLRLCGLSPENKRVLRACCLDNRLRTYDDRQDAVLGAARPCNPR
jgi:anti-anti-sigma factor